MRPTLQVNSAKHFLNTQQNSASNEVSHRSLCEVIPGTGLSAESPFRRMVSFVRMGRKPTFNQRQDLLKQSPARTEQTGRHSGGPGEQSARSGESPPRREKNSFPVPIKLDSSCPSPHKSDVPNDGRARLRFFPHVEKFGKSIYNPTASG